MCGIVGYIGKKETTKILLDGLKELEYRGYDSAGIVLYDGNDLKLSKTKGKVSDLEAKAESEKTTFGKVGMGHTRWATHGVPNDVNSHPHFSNSGKLVIIHNGIIENYEPLKKELIKRGWINNTKDVKEQIRELRSFFKIASLDYFKNVEEKLINILQSIFNVYNLKAIEHYFFNLNNNYLLQVRFLKEIELHCNLKLDQNDLIAIHTADDLKKLVEKIANK